MSDHADDRPLARGGMVDPKLAFKIGDFSGHIISDGQVPYPTDFVFSNAPAEVLQSGLAGRLDERGELRLPYHCLLVTTPSQNLLIDAGLGQAAATAWDRRQAGCSRASPGQDSRLPTSTWLSSPTGTQTTAAALSTPAS